MRALVIFSQCATIHSRSSEQQPGCISEEQKHYAPLSIVLALARRGKMTGIVEQYKDAKAITGTLWLQGGRVIFAKNPTKIRTTTASYARSTNGKKYSLRRSGSNRLVVEDISKGNDGALVLIGHLSGRFWDRQTVKVAEIKFTGERPMDRQKLQTTRIMPTL